MSAAADELMMAIQKYGELCKLVPLEEERGSTEQADLYAVQAQEVLSQIRAHVRELTMPKMSSKFSE